MENNAQLPVEVVEQIKQEGQNMLAFAPDNKWSYIQGATAYATKLNELQQENEKLKLKHSMAVRLLQTTSDQCRMRKSLFNEIKKFLYGE